MGQKLKSNKNAKTLNITHQSIRSSGAKYQRRRSDFLFMILLVWGSWMNFLSSNDIKQPSRQSQARTKTFHPAKSIMPPPSNFPVNQKINNHKQWQHYSWVLNRVFYFSQLLALCRTQTISVWSFPKSEFKFRKQQWREFDWKNNFPWLYKKKHCKKQISRGFILFQFYFVSLKTIVNWGKNNRENWNFSVHSTLFFLKIHLAAHAATCFPLWEKLDIKVCVWAS